MNKQEKLWASKFGSDYHDRNHWEYREKFWTDILGDTVLQGAWSVLEPGAGKGENLTAIMNARGMELDIKMDYDQLVGIEVNQKACEQMQKRGIVAYNNPFLDVALAHKFALVITRGFLMHVPKAALQATLAKIYNASSKYICLVEYYSPVRREVEYHGEGSALWIDDFAGKIMQMYPDLTLLDYGFKYYKDDNGGDLTYFLLEK